MGTEPFRPRLAQRRQLPVIMQVEAAECGLVCLAMVAAFHGSDPGMADLRRRFAPSIKGMNLARLLAIAERLQLDARAIRIELDELAELQTPSVLHWGLNHFVVLRAVRGGTFVIHDPAVGVRRVSREEVSRKFTGIAVELSPGERFERASPPPAIRLRDLTGPVRGLWTALGQLLLLSLVLQAFTVVMPFYMQWTIDHALLSADRDLLLVLGLGFLLVVLFQSLIGLLRGWAVIVLSASLGLQWSKRILGHLLKLPIGYFEKRHLGDVVSRMGASQAILATLSRSFVEALVDGLMAITTLAMMMLYSVGLSALTLAAVAIYLVLRLLAFRPLRRATEQQILCAAVQQSHLLESLRGIQSIKLAGSESTRAAGWQSLLVGTTNQELQVSRLGLGFAGASELVFGIERVVVIWIAAVLVLDGDFSIGMLIAFVAYKEQFSGRIASLIDKLLEFRMLGMHGERLADIVLTPPEPHYDLQDDSPLGAVRSIEVCDLAFHYAEGEPPVLDGCSFKVMAGESIAVVGPSGCGKTTLTKLMLGLLTPTRGKVLVNGVDIHGPAQRGYREAIAAVMQDDQLFQGSLSDNIAFFDPAPDMQKVERAARAAGIDQEIMAMPMGYNTLVGDMGAALSGGQKQRVILARALYREPQVLFLDEATSHLDVERERSVNEAIRSLNIIRIMVAHRPETIASADRVIHLWNGRVEAPPPFQPRAPALVVNAP